jgi:hypothetical protein
MIDKPQQPDHGFPHGQPSEKATPSGSRGPQGLGEEAASALADRFAASSGIPSLEEAKFLQSWIEDRGCLIPEHDWLALPSISRQTAEHEVRFRESDHRAVKRTWPGTFGFTPRFESGTWIARPAWPAEYLKRFALQNMLFGDSVRLEGGMISEEPSLVLGQASGGLSLVISQPWLDAANPLSPHPSEAELRPYLSARGFSPLFQSFYGWIDEAFGYVLLDAKEDNFILTEAGILPIDLLIAKIETSPTSY